MSRLYDVSAVALGQRDVVALFEEAETQASRILQFPERVDPARPDLRRPARRVLEAATTVVRRLQHHEKGRIALLMAPPRHVQPAAVGQRIVQPDLLAPVLRQEHTLHEGNHRRIERIRRQTPGPEAFENLRLVLATHKLAEEVLLCAFQTHEKIDLHVDPGCLVLEIPQRDLQPRLRARLVGRDGFLYCISETKRMRLARRFRD